MLLSHYKDKEETNLSKVSGTKYVQKKRGILLRSDLSAGLEVHTKTGKGGIL